MELGWIDFSKTERSKILTVLDLLGEKGVLDELGIAPIRDGFSDLFFPGTSTIQTRAKYFFIVPYAFKDLELNNQLKYHRLKKIFDDTERQCGEVLVGKFPNENGIIGRVSILNNKWVQRTPASIYWAGLRRYGFVRSKISINHYIKLISLQKQNKTNTLSLGNSSDENSHDDKNAGVNEKFHILNVPTYKRDWFDDLDINLTHEEGQFLKERIIMSCPDTMIAYVLDNDLWEVLDVGSFSGLEALIYEFPQKIQDDYFRALSFSEFVYALRVVYNLIVSDNKNEKAISEFRSLNLEEISNVNVNDIMNSLHVFNPHLRSFLMKSRESMENGDIEGLRRHIINREVSLKGINRSKTAHPGEFDFDEWFSGTTLDYRFGNAKNIIRDIHESEKKVGEI